MVSSPEKEGRATRRGPLVALRDALRVDVLVESSSVKAGVCDPGGACFCRLRGAENVVVVHVLTRLFGAQHHVPAVSPGCGDGGTGCRGYRREHDAVAEGRHQATTELLEVRD